MEALRVPVEPTTRLIEDLFRDTPVTVIEVGLTVTEHVAVLLPSEVLAVIVADPAALAVTVPSDDTVATEVLFDDHVTVLFVAFEGETEALSEYDWPGFNEIDLGDTDTPVTDTTALTTVTLQVAVLLPSTVVTVIVELPEVNALISPEDETVATAGLPEENFTEVLDAFEG